MEQNALEREEFEDCFVFTSWLANGFVSYLIAQQCEPLLNCKRQTLTFPISVVPNFSNLLTIFTHKCTQTYSFVSFFCLCRIFLMKSY